MYTFSNAPDPVLDVVNRAAAVLKCPVELFGSPPFLEPSVRDSANSKLTTVHHVRDVAPKKLMLCLSFTLPLEVALREETGSDTAAALSLMSDNIQTGKRSTSDREDSMAEAKKLRI